MGMHVCVCILCVRVCVCGCVNAHVYVRACGCYPLSSGDGVVSLVKEAVEAEAVGNDRLQGRALEGGGAEGERAWGEPSIRRLRVAVPPVKRGGAVEDGDRIATACSEVDARGRRPDVPGHRVAARDVERGVTPPHEALCKVRSGNRCRLGLDVKLGLGSGGDD